MSHDTAIWIILICGAVVSVVFGGAMLIGSLAVFPATIIAILLGWAVFGPVGAVVGWAICGVIGCVVLNKH